MSRFYKSNNSYQINQIVHDYLVYNIDIGNRICPVWINSRGYHYAVTQYYLPILKEDQVNETGVTSNKIARFMVDSCFHKITQNGITYQVGKGVIINLDRMRLLAQWCRGNIRNDYRYQTLMLEPYVFQSSDTICKYLRGSYTKQCLLEGAEVIVLYSDYSVESVPVGTTELLDTKTKDLENNDALRKFFHIS